ncbi:MAG TPA: hypothetical protein VG815_13445 [Chloroflexota bacterium]|nr:hypothetical protein [Chloroflexota bacterium]
MPVVVWLVEKADSDWATSLIQSEGIDGIKTGSVVVNRFGVLAAVCFASLVSAGLASTRIEVRAASGPPTSRLAVVKPKIVIIKENRSFDNLFEQSAPGQTQTRAGVAVRPPHLLRPAGSDGYPSSATNNPGRQPSAVSLNSRRKQPAAPLPVKLRLTVGFWNSFRSGTLVPVRVTATNRTAQTLSGVVVVPDLESGSRAAYQMPLVLAAHATKQITIYMPAAGVTGTVVARFADGARRLGAAVQYAHSFGGSTMTLGALTADPSTITWLRQVHLSGGQTIQVVPLGARNFDPVPAVLANFDAILEKDGTIASLDFAQVAALDQYVHDGGSLVLVGGPGWEQTLNPLPRDLMPGVVSGTRILPNLSALQSLTGQYPKVKSGTVAVSFLRRPGGDVLAAKDGLPLAVDSSIGSGRVLYLAFDPSLAPVAGWPGRSAMLGALLAKAAPLSMGRSTAEMTGGWVGPPLLTSAAAGDMAAELDNVPAPALAWVIGLVALAALYILLLGPLSFWTLRRMGRRELTWVVVPIGAVLCTAATFGVTGAVKSRSVLVNTIGIVQLGGQSSARPATLYMGVFAPESGSYDLTMPGSGFPEPVSNGSDSSFPGSSSNVAFSFSYWPQPVNAGSGAHTALRFQEGSQTRIDFMKMDSWSMQNAEVKTTVPVPGGIHKDLHIDHSGRIVGWVKNDTPLNLVRPAIVAGGAFVRLPDLAAGETAVVRITPSLNVHNTQSQSIWPSMLGQPSWSGSSYYGPSPQAYTLLSSANGPGPSLPPVQVQPALRVRAISIAQPLGFGTGYGAPQEASFAARLRNVGNLMPEAQSLDSLGPVYFVAWNQQALTPMTVNGATPDIRELNLITQPLAVGSLRGGTFTFHRGTFGPTLVDLFSANPRTNGGSWTTCTNNVCTSGPSPTRIDVGTHGWATFEFRLPDAGRLDLKHLSLFVSAGGANSIDMGRVWDWRPGRWIHFDLRTGQANLDRPNRFISSSGTVRIKLVNTDFSRDMRMADFNHGIQISGNGVVR